MVKRAVGSKTVVKRARKQLAKSKLASPKKLRKVVKPAKPVVEVPVVSRVAVTARNWPFARPK